MTPPTASLVAAANDLAPALQLARDAFTSLSREVDPIVQAVAREADEAFLDETDPTRRAMLEGRVCQRTRASVQRLGAARRELSALLAALAELQKDVADLAAYAPEPAREPAPEGDA